MNGGMVMDFSQPVQIKASARLIYHLGEQLISDELVALLELIKNAYDADATSVQVIIENEEETAYGKGKITIIDNGNGMLPSVIVNSFLRLATGYKKQNKISPYYKRRVLGEKGLGRLSFQRLGKYIEVSTVPRVNRLNPQNSEDLEYINKRGINKFNIKMNWDIVEDDADFEELQAEVELQKDDFAKGGTTITIYGIRNSNFWILNKEKRERLQSEILSMTNPFVVKTSEDRFNLKVNINGESFLVDTVDENIVNKLSDVSVYFKMDKGVLTVKSNIKEKYFNRLKDEYLKKQENLKLCLIEDTCTYSKYEENQLIIDFNNTKEVQNIPWIKEDIFNRIDNKYAVDFLFEGWLYAVDMQAANRTEISKELLNQSIYIQKNFTKIGALWKKIAGIYMYRDKFRILPYGENDWIGFTALSQKSKATIYKQGNVSGYIMVNGRKSEQLKEQTDRQGILQDETGFNFLNILKRIIAQQVFFWDTNGLRANFSAPKENRESGLFLNADQSLKFSKLPDKETKYMMKQKELEKTLKTKVDSSAQLTLFQDDEILRTAKEYKVASEEYNQVLKQKIGLLNETIEEYQEIIPLLGQSIIFETITHELHRVQGQLSTTVSELEKINEDSHWEKAHPKKELSKIIQLFKREINDFNMQLLHLAPTHRNKLKEEVNLSLETFIKDNYVLSGVIATQLKNAGIKCQVSGMSFSKMMSIGNAIVIFDNLILNSKYWLEKFDIQNPTIYFEFIKSDKEYLLIWDNGRGIDRMIENILFEPFKSQKELGRGLGLYITRELLALSDANIELLSERNNYGNLYKFKIEF